MKKKSKPVLLWQRKKTIWVWKWAATHLIMSSHFYNKTFHAQTANSGQVFGQGCVSGQTVENYRLQPLQETYLTLTELLSHTSSIMCHFYTEMRCKVATGGDSSNPGGSEARWPLTCLWLLCLIQTPVAQRYGKSRRCQTVVIKYVFQPPYSHSPSPKQMRDVLFLSLFLSRLHS